MNVKQREGIFIPHKFLSVKSVSRKQISNPPLSSHLLMSLQLISLFCSLLISKRVFSSQLANQISESNFCSCGMFYYEITIFLF